MNGGDITSANVAAVMTVKDLYPAGFKWEAFSADQAFTVESVQLALTRMGVDGGMSAGYTPQPYPITVVFEPWSPTIEFIEHIIKSTQTNKRVYWCELAMDIPALDKSFQLVQGTLTNITPVPAIQDVLQPMTYTWSFAELRPVRV